MNALSIFELFLATLAGVGAQGVRIGSGTLFVTTLTGAPARLGFGSIFAAFGLIVTGHTGSIQSGDVVISYLPAAPLFAPTTVTAPSGEVAMPVHPVGGS